MPQSQVQPTVSQQYKLSLVSGGTPSLPRASYSSSCNKNISCLTADQLNYIVPFNNQIKLFSIETRQCVKTLKFNNNEILSKIFDSTSVAHIALGDLLTLSADEGKNEEKFITIFTKNGQIIVLNYKGKLIESPKIVNLNLSPEQSIFKVFQSTDGKGKAILKILTIVDKPSSSLATYHLYDSSDDKPTLALIKSFENVISLTWSSNDHYIAILSQNKESTSDKKMIHIQSIFDDSYQREFPLASVLSKTTTQHQPATTSNNSRYVSSMAIDNNASQLALGFVSGVISIVNLGENANLQTRLLKWHIDSVLSLAFNEDGTYLLSGGWEKVLIFWQLSTNLQQFLPRLNGIIVDCQIIGSKYYSISLQMIENPTMSQYQILLLNSSDLISKLSINGPLPIFANPIKSTIQPISSINTKMSNSISKLISFQEKQQRKLHNLKRQDFTTCIKINPITKNLYFPHVSSLQIFNFYKNDQISYQNMTSTLSNSMGKVKTELNIKEPTIANLTFTHNGDWLITYEIEYQPSDLLSSNDQTHILKFWSLIPESNQWELKTKIINPHGINVPIIKLIPSPIAFPGKEIGILTADNNGGLKYWSIVEEENNEDARVANWSLTKMLPPNFNHFSNCVSVAWSHDGSLIFHGFEYKLQILEFNHDKDGSEGFVKVGHEFNFDSEIQTITLSNDSNLIVVTKTNLVVINLLLGAVVTTLDIYPFVDGAYKNGNLERLIACDQNSGNVALVLNGKAQDEKDEVKYNSKIIVFNSDLSVKIDIFNHDEYISWIGWNYDSDFIFLDMSLRLGVIGTTVNNEMIDEVNKEGIFDGLMTTTGSEVITSNENNLNTGDKFVEQLRKLSNKTNTNIDAEAGDDMVTDLINGEKKEKSLNMKSFTGMFDNIQNIQMDTLFDSVMKVIS
ncbi:Nan1p NDAI_0E02190 [Naumovozyma dairenensis CBS 421]|uniref:WD repeat-containing protein 75 second beta-propeller domain-containing protein n=1 Tax=Naumovozyma dairenensis (strain ATCC 10597 / BCRC 20456 / CBS 421 / NBRC 0211 / NRRL Y-12639) TaxID=1071378 RepID=G0WBB6_NAUDC|nr:hypothetical protein NDAI_0E02190 [Naumovozyma dairenensis CBS 421]CCD25036.1 hypothetical protein NDAI_0E02190 [Naumovozyma dairenensis CBS 421]